VTIFGRPFWSYDSPSFTKFPPTILSSTIPPPSKLLASPYRASSFSDPFFFSAVNSPLPDQGVSLAAPMFFTCVLSFPSVLHLFDFVYDKSRGVSPSQVLYWYAACLTFPRPEPTEGRDFFSLLTFLPMGPHHKLYWTLVFSLLTTWCLARRSPDGLRSPSGYALLHP